MQQPRMIVLALIAQGRDYGLAMEDFVERSRMRQWAKIGSSTIYKALKDLERDGCVKSELKGSKRGAGKKVFSLTGKGRKELGAQIGEALASREPVYSDRIAGMIFAAVLPKADARRMMETTEQWLEGGFAKVKREKARVKGDAIAEITLDYYRAVYRAEQKALEAMRRRVLSD